MSGRQRILHLAGAMLVALVAADAPAKERREPCPDAQYDLVGEPLGSGTAASAASGSTTPAASTGR